LLIFAYICAYQQMRRNVSSHQRRRMRRIRNEQSIAKVKKKKREKETTRKVDKPRQTHSIVAEERIV